MAASLLPWVPFDFKMLDLTPYSPLETLDTRDQRFYQKAINYLTCRVTAALQKYYESEASSNQDWWNSRLQSEMVIGGFSCSL